MSLPQTYDLTIVAGETLKRWFALKYPDNTIANLATTGYTTGRLTVRDKYAGTAILTLTTANGGVNLTYQADSEGTNWTGFIYASAASTAALTDWGDGVYDFEISNGVDVIRVLQGPAFLSPEATT